MFGLKANYSGEITSKGSSSDTIEPFWTWWLPKEEDFVTIAERL